MAPPKIKIIIGNLGRTAESGVYIDGVKLPYTYNVEFAAPVCEMPTVRVDMHASEVEIECDDANITLGVNELRALATQEVTTTVELAADAELPDEAINRIVEAVLDRLNAAQQTRRP